MALAPPVEQRRVLRLISLFDGNAAYVVHSPLLRRVDGQADCRPLCVWLDQGDTEGVGSTTRTQ
jgi:hypothetical protein